MKRWLIFALCFTMLTCNLIAFNSKAEAAENETTLNENELYALSAVLMDADSGRILYGKNEDTQRPMASTTKILTCILALEQGNLQDMVDVSEYAAGMPDVQLNMKVGESYRLEDLMYSMMLESHNDSAVAIAEHIGGSVENFASMMNEKAREIGCKNSHFVTPNGLDGTSDGQVHSTTANELALIMRYCIMESPKREEFKEITRTMSYSFQNMIKTDDGSYVKGSRSFTCNNHNALFSIISGTISGKTGFTGDAGYCYVGAVENEGRTYILALLGCGWPYNKNYKWSDCKKLITYGTGNFHLEHLVVPDLQELNLPQIPVLDAQSDQPGQSVYLEVEMEDRTLPFQQILLSEGEKLTIRYELLKEMKAPVKRGEQVGTLEICLDGQTLYETNFYSKSNIKSIDYSWCFKKMIEKFFF